jgi:hypothetical protein
MNSFRLRRRPRTAPGTGRAFPRLEVLESRNLFSVNLDLARGGLGFTGFIPPDTIGAVGPNHFVEAVNTTVGIYDKGTGNLLSSRGLGTFFSPLGGVLSQTDPFVSYDTFTNQFVVGMIDFNSAVSRLDLAVSNTSDPTGSWTFSRYDMTHDSISGTYLSDYPRFGYNADAYVISFNMFPSPSGTQHVDTLSVRKSDLAGFVFAWPTGTVQFPGMSPAVMHDAAPGDPMWLVGGPGQFPPNIRVFKMTNELSGSPTVTASAVPVPSYAAMSAPRQPGGTMSWTFDTRIFNAAMRGGMLVATHGVRVGSADVARWYEFDTTGATPTLAQEGQVNPDASTDTYFPTIDINAAGSLGLTYIESSPSEFMSMYVTGRTTADPPGTMETPVVAFQGASNYTVPRAGDYSGISVDPSNGLTFWAANEYKGASFSTWNTGLASFDVASVATATHFSIVPLTDPVTAGTAFSATVTALDASNNVVPDYQGTVHFTSTDPQVTSGNGLPADYAFTAADSGVHTFSITLLTAGSQTTAVSDTADGTITGSAVDNVLPGQAVAFQVGAPATATAGVPFDFTVTAVDPYGNTDPTYTGTVAFSTQDPAGTFNPTGYTFGPGDLGSATFSQGATLNSAGTWDVTATDTTSGFTGSAFVTLGGPAPPPSGNPPPSARPVSVDTRVLPSEGAVSREVLLSDPAVLGLSSTGSLPVASQGWHALRRGAGGAWALDAALWELAQERNGA